MVSESQAPNTIGAQLAQAKRALAAAGVATPGGEALELLGAVLGIPSALLAQRSRRRLSPEAIETYAGWIVRRAAGESIPHITGHLAFMELDLLVDSATPLVPPYAARLVEAALECARRGRQNDVLAAELGTGCGAIALALAAFEPRFGRIYALDSSAEALRTAEANGARYLLNLVVTWLPGDGLGAVPEQVDLIICAQSGLADSVRFAALVASAPAKLRAEGTLIFGLNAGQAEPAEAAVLHVLPHAQVWADAQADGVVVVAQVPRPSVADAALEMER